MWPVMRGSAASGTVPQTVCEFDFAWDHKQIAEALAKKKAQKGEAMLFNYQLVRLECWS